MLGIQPRDCSKLVKNQKMTTTSQFPDMTSMSTFFDVVFFFFLVKFSCWSKFHVNTITGSAIMTFLFYKGLTRNPEIGNTPVWALPNIWRLGWVMDAKFGKNVSNRILMKAAKFQGYSFYYFWVIKENQLGGGGVKLAPPHTQIRVKWNENFEYFLIWSLFLADQWRWIGKIDSCVLVK